MTDERHRESVNTTDGEFHCLRCRALQIALRGVVSHGKGITNANPGGFGLAWRGATNTAVAIAFDVMYRLPCAECLALKSEESIQLTFATDPPPPDVDNTPIQHSTVNAALASLTAEQVSRLGFPPPSEFPAPQTAGVQAGSCGGLQGGCTCGCHVADHNPDRTVLYADCNYPECAAYWEAEALSTRRELGGADASP